MLKCSGQRSHRYTKDDSKTPAPEHEGKRGTNPVGVKIKEERKVSRKEDRKGENQGKDCLLMKIRREAPKGPIVSRWVGGVGKTRFLVILDQKMSSHRNTAGSRRHGMEKGNRWTDMRNNAPVRKEGERSCSRCRKKKTATEGGILPKPDGGNGEDVQGSLQGHC